MRVPACWQTVMRCSVDIAQVVPALGADPQAAVGFLLRRQMQAHPTADIPTLVVNTLKVLHGTCVLRRPVSCLLLKALLLASHAPSDEHTSSTA